jgi:hypothetical protein
MEWVRNFGNWVRRPGMPKPQAGIKINFGSRFQLGPRDGLPTEEDHGTSRVGFWPVALQAERIHLSACLGFELRAMGIVADQALAVLIGAMPDRILRCLMAPLAQAGPGGEQVDRCFVFLGDDVVTVRTTHLNCGVNEPGLFLFGMAGQAGFRLDISGLDVGVLELFLGGNSHGQEETER